MAKEFNVPSMNFSVRRNSRSTATSASNGVVSTTEVDLLLLSLCNLRPPPSAAVAHRILKASYRCWRSSGLTQNKSTKRCNRL
ncbi:hypothetical protein H5410_060237 [Solanum commersonii]|uniref:Uncharacterized protein n=1 Tax=Solanum commersonii TaxID=4109 RepID=A0A9J5W517_SOLCO|nr:hypothetical protein H5410_060237 [Solanum commersonii]